ncbi:MAG: hypothetical protein IJS89_01565 [Bacteroidaceae bacterium]|nr:hypothetical protein [Bacteroidaceae bacterium]
MKKLTILALGLALLLPTGLKAQDSEMFNHLGLGFSLGTDGIGFEAAMPIGQYVQARTGVSFMPAFSYSDKVKLYTTTDLATGAEYDNKVKAKGKLNMTDWKLLFDIYPSKKSAFHFTVGFYLGKENVVKAKNTEIDDDGILRNGGAILIGGQPFGANTEGIANIHVRANSFKPYLGIGFGRAVPREHRVAVTCDLGVQFWGKPKVYAYNDDILHGGMKEVRYQDIDRDSSASDCRKAIKIINGIFVWPVINIRINGRIF